MMMMQERTGGERELFDLIGADRCFEIPRIMIKYWQGSGNVAGMATVWQVVVDC